MHRALHVELLASHAPRGPPKASSAHRQRLRRPRRRAIVTDPHTQVMRGEADCPRPAQIGTALPMIPRRDRVNVRAMADLDEAAARDIILAAASGTTTVVRAPAVPSP